MPNTNAVIGGSMTGAVKEDEILTATGQLTIDDVEGEREFMAFSYGGNYGNLSLTKDGAWTYESDNWDSWQEGRSYIDEITIAAKDGTFAKITITVNGTNDAPIITTPYGSASTNEEEPLTGSLGVSDADHDPLYYSSPGGEHGTVFFWGDRFTYTPDPDFYGWDGFDVTISDGQGGTVTTSVGVLVGNEWEAPFGTDKSVTIAEDGSHTVVVDDFGFSDYKDAGSQINHFDAVIISVVSGGGKLWFGNAELDLSGGAVMISKADIEAGKLVWIPDADATGEAHITFKVKDDIFAEAWDSNTSKDPNTLTINVAAVNDAPSFQAGADQTVIEDSGSHVIANWATLITAGPSNESEQTLLFDVGNDNAALFEEGPSISADGTLTYKLAANAFGSATVTVVLKDNGSDEGDNDNSSAPMTFTITAEGVDDAPTLNLSNSLIAENSAAGKKIGALSGFDVDGGDFVSFALGSNPGKMFRIVDGNLVVSKNARFDFETQSAYAVDILATDDQGTTVAQTFTIEVTDVRENPRGTNGSDKLFGDAMDNAINGKGGNDRLTGGAGADTFVFGRAYGRDVVLDFDLTQGDVIDLSKAAGINSFNDLKAHHASEAGSNIRIETADGAVLTISHIDLSNLTKDMFLF